MHFSPAFLSSLIVEPLRYLYANYGPEELRWNEDPKISTVEIDTINNFNKIAIQAKPRILLGRGQYSINPTGLTDNMAQSPDSRTLQGLKNNTNFLMIQGVSQILIEARNEGTCEKMVDITTHFLSWMTPLISDSQGFKMFGLPMNVSGCSPNREDTELFQCTINIPWSKEEQWKVVNDGVDLKRFIFSITQA
jgi:hypothetical protein